MELINDSGLLMNGRLYTSAAAASIQYSRRMGFNVMVGNKCVCVYGRTALQRKASLLHSCVSDCGVNIESRIKALPTMRLKPQAISGSNHCFQETVK